MPLEEDVLPSKEQLLPAAVSPTADSPGYILESDLEEDLQKDLEEDDEDCKEDPDDYPTDRYDDDNEEEESYSDEADDKDEDREEEEEHPSPVDSVPPPVYRVMILSPPLPIPSPPLPISSTYPLEYKDAMIWLRAEASSTSHPPPPIVLPHTMASVAMLRDVAPSTYILAS
nr:hypothetical protein [Tanacetum cinerariifolium]